MASQADPRPSSPNAEKFDELQKICRICFEVATANNPIKSPCSCNGSVKYVHDECLKKWILFIKKDSKSFKCDLCKDSMNIQIKFKCVISFQRLKSEIIKILIFPLILILLNCFIIIILCFFYESTTDPKVPIVAKIYILLFFVSCIIMDVKITRGLFSAVKNGCFERKINSWILFNKKNKENLDVTVLSESKQMVQGSFRDLNDFQALQDTSDRIGFNSKEILKIDHEGLEMKGKYVPCCRNNNLVQDL